MLAFILVYIGIAILCAYGMIVQTKRHYKRYSDVYEQLGYSKAKDYGIPLLTLTLSDYMFCICTGFIWPLGWLLDDSYWYEVFQGYRVLTKHR